MKKFWDIVFNVINEAGMILEVIDSRMPEKTRNEFIENYTVRRHKKLIIVINKCDLASKEELEIIKAKFSKEFPCIFISAREHLGTLILKRKIMQYATKLPVRVGVIGYPNTGKSSIINALKGEHAAKTSPMAGFTKAKQWIRASKNILLIDSPGVIPYSSQKTETELVLSSSKTLQTIKDPEKVAVDILKSIFNKNKGIIKEKYGVEPNKISFKTLELIAIAKKKLRKHAVPDTEIVARMIIQDYQKGKLMLK